MSKKRKKSHYQPVTSDIKKYIKNANRRLESMSRLAPEDRTQEFYDVQEILRRRSFGRYDKKKGIWVFKQSRKFTEKTKQRERQTLLYLLNSRTVPDVKRLKKGGWGEIIEYVTSKYEEKGISSDIVVSILKDNYSRRDQDLQTLEKLTREAIEKITDVDEYRDSLERHEEERSVLYLDPENPFSIWT